MVADRTLFLRLGRLKEISSNFGCSEMKVVVCSPLVKSGATILITTDCTS